MNCIIIEDDEAARLVLRHLISQTDFLTLQREYTTAVEAVANPPAGVDLIFLDIEMPGMNGIEYLESLVNPPLIIVTTSKVDYAASAFEYQVTDYLVKPFTMPRFFKAVNKAKEQYDQMGGAGLQSTQDHIYVKSDSKLIRIDLSKVLYIEALADYVFFHLVDDRLVVHSTMKNLESRLAGTHFSRVHRSYIVNLNAIELIEDLNVLINNRHIPIGASYKEAFMKRLHML